MNLKANQVADWKYVTFGDVVQLKQGLCFNKKTKHLVVDDGLPILRITDLINGTEVQFADRDNVPEQFVAVPEDIIYSRTGQVGLVFRGKIGVVHNNCFRVIPNCEVSRDYLYWYLRMPEVVKYARSLASGAAQPDLTHDAFKGMPFRYPCLATQSLIASIPSVYEEFIENNNRRIQLLEKSARLLYKEWFVYLRFPGHEHVKITDGVPDGWDNKTAFDVMEVLSGGTPKTKIAEFWDGDIPFFTPKDTTDYSFTYLTEKMITDQGLSKCNSRLYPKYTLFITARGTVGKLSFAQRAMAMNQSCYALVGKGFINQLFLYCSLKASIDQFKARASGAVFDAIVVDTFKRIPFLEPSSMLIEQFTDVVKDTFEQVDQLSSMNRKLAEARDILLPRLMNGELAV